LQIVIVMKVQKVPVKRVMGVTMGREWFIRQARRRRLDLGFRICINRSFKRYRYKSVSDFLPPLSFSMSKGIVALAARRAMTAPARHLLFAIGTILAVLALSLPAEAIEGHTLIIPPNDGYGFDQCLTPGSQCGLILADAWCKAYGFTGSRGFRPETSGTPDVPIGSIWVTCGAEVD
jgi:hypothetical protein